MSSLNFAVLSLTDFRTIVEEKFNIWPCIFQAEVAGFENVGKIIQSADPPQ